MVPLSGIDVHKALFHRQCWSPHYYIVMVHLTPESLCFMCIILTESYLLVLIEFNSEVCLLAFSCLTLPCHIITKQIYGFYI